MSICRFLYTVTYITFYVHTYFAISGKGNAYGGGGSDFSCSGKTNGRYTNTDSCSNFWNCLNGHRLNNYFTVCCSNNR